MTKPNTKQDNSKPSNDEFVRLATGQVLSTDFSHLKKDHPNTEFRLVNDEKGEVEQMMRLGWQPVEGSSTAGSFLESQENSKQNNKKPSNNAKSGVSYINVHVGQISTRSDGRAVLMKIDLDLFNLIQTEKMKQIDKFDEALRGGENQSGTSAHTFADPTQAGGSDQESQDLATYAPKLPDGQRGFAEKNQGTLV